MMNDDLDDVLSRIALHVESDVVEAEPTMFDDADVVFSRKLKRLMMWGWPEQYCKLKLPFACVDDVDAERKAGMLRAWLMGMAGKGMLAVVLGLRGTGKTLSACKLARDCGYERAWYFSGDGLYRERLAKIGLGGSFERDFAVQIGHRRKSLLVLDEFQRGIGYKGEGRDLSLDYFEEIINSRYNAELDTVIVANWTQEDFNQFMPDSVKDRVIQRRSENRGGVRWCGWRSFRRA